MENEYLPKVTFEAIPIRDLVSDQEYQRNLSERHVRRAVADFDIHQINPVKVSRRDGVNYVFNGQHTMEIVAAISGSRDTPVWCMVYDDLDYRNEANVFANQQKYVKGLTPYEIFMANIEASNDKELLIKDLVESYHLRIVPSSQDGGICAVSALEFIYDRCGYEILSRTLRLSIGAWEGSQQSLGASVLKGIARVLAVYGEEVKDDIFVEKLGNLSIREIIRTAKERKGGMCGYAEAILLGYNNQRMNTPLAITKLYERNPPKAALPIEESLRAAFEQGEGSRTDEEQADSLGRS